ncbi:hypothetical protein ACIQ9P_32905 [Kitasatospora sp. NPDC094019]|uniref:hypothetical protein n=1 Tax=Kitasatospora sp. NPDC094019 TaxID=3364091 RepID=UPI003830360F
MSSNRTRRFVASAVLGASLVALAAPAQATSSVGGQIATSEILSRAQYWVNNHVPYNQGGYAADQQGKTYREDCSGYVSMAWHLGTSLVVTDGGPSFTNADGSPNSTYDTAVGDFSNLQPGDAMAYPHQHIWLFAGWTDKATGDFTYYAESNPGNPTHGPSTANIHNSTIEGWPTSGYVALRYKNAATTPTAPTLTDGTFVNVTETGQVFRMAGGAPIAVTDWNNVGGFQSYVNISQAQFNTLPTYPADGTALAAGTGIYVVAGGAPIYVSDFSHVPGIAQRTVVDPAALDRAGTGGAFNHLRTVPVDGTAIAGGVNGGVYVIAGGAPVYVSDFSHVPGIAQRTVVDETAVDLAGSGGVYNHLRAVPADGTFLNDGTTGQVYRVAGGAPIAVTDWANVGGFQSYTTVDTNALGLAGSNTTSYSHLRRTPADGTVLRGYTTGKLYTVQGGHPTPTTTGQPVTSVDQVAIDKAGQPGAFSHLS